MRILNTHVIGCASHAYVIAEGWGKLPANMAYGYTHGVCVDSQDNVYVHHTGKEPVIVFDRDGRFLTSWGKEFEGEPTASTCIRIRMARNICILQTGCAGSWLKPLQTGR